MSNIITYINRYGNLTFDELKYNELDSLVLSVISYVDFDGILENNKDNKMRLQDAAKVFFTRYSKKELMNNISGVTTGIKIFEYIKNEKRYQDLLLYNYSYKRDNDKQFSGLFIDINEEETFISFEGTDDLISGWKEDCEMTYHFPIPAQREAIHYINRSIPIFSKRTYILGGHSKGGNLAVVAGMYAIPLIKQKIKKIISFDGPGFKIEQIRTRYYKSIIPKLELIVPDKSLFGVLLKHDKNFTVISSSKPAPMSHNILFWDVDITKFIPSKLSESSKETVRIVDEWLDKYTDQERERLIEQLFAIFKRAKVDTLVDIKVTNIPLMITLIEESKKIDEVSKAMLKTLVNLILNYIRSDSKGILHKRVNKN